MIRVVTSGNTVSLERKGTNEEVVEEYLGTFMALISSYIDLAKEYYSSEEEIDGLIAKLRRHGVDTAAGAAETETPTGTDGEMV